MLTLVRYSRLQEFSQSLSGERSSTRERPAQDDRQPITIGDLDVVQVSPVSAKCSSGAGPLSLAHLDDMEVTAFSDSDDVFDPAVFEPVRAERAIPSPTVDGH